MAYITLTRENIGSEHICCALSDRKCSEGYELKKQWLATQFDQGYVFRRLDERAKVLIEYGPAERAWVPVTAPNYMMIGCFWVSGKYKGAGHGKALLQQVIDDAKNQGKDGLVTAVGAKKLSFMNDTKWLLAHGFEVCDSIPSTGFALVSMEFEGTSDRPRFSDSVRSGVCPEKEGCVVYYSNRCPYSEYYVREQLVESREKRAIPLRIVKLETMEQAQCAPAPATIFSLFYKGDFVTTDISACMDSRFDRTVAER